MIQNVEAAGVPWHSFVSHTLYVRSAGNTVPYTLSLCSRDMFAVLCSICQNRMLLHIVTDVGGMDIATCWC